jgi:flagellar basal body P-ring formation protein FlgA
MIRLVLALALVAPPALAEIAVTTRTVPARALIGPTDVTVAAEVVPGAIADPAELIGMEARVALYPGRPIAPGDVGPPAVVERNQLIPLVYSQGGLVITTEGRALDRAAPGDVIDVMNLASRTTVVARIGLDGAAHVAP